MNEMLSEPEAKVVCDVDNMTRFCEEDAAASPPPSSGVEDGLTWMPLMIILGKKTHCPMAEKGR